ncbi:MAG: GW dipeptide domain-containing protein [Bacteroidetes bacterium]|nr:GW dipeptide domain-containing protein [Bacteroidota bacterium]
MKISKILSLLIISVLISCKSKPKVIEEEMANTGTFAAGTTSMPSSGSNDSEFHDVTAIEILNAERYTYLRVVEKLDTFWIAATKFDAKKGNQYFYRGGLLKTDFESQEHHRVFDKIYLVSEIIDVAAHPGSNGQMQQAPVSVDTKELKNVPGTQKLSAVFENKQNLNGKKVKVSGKVVKANYGIMNFNWIHIQDGSMKGGKPLDLTITTTENIPMGANVAIEGTLILNKDFGAGYKYDLLIENGKSL